MLMALDKWRSYIQHQQFILRIDHKSLMFPTEQRATTRLQQEATLKLMDLNYKIQYKQGVTNKAANALSRMGDSENEVSAISAGQPSWLQILQAGYLEDPEARIKLTELSVSRANDKGYSLVDGVIRYKNRIWVGTTALAQRHILQALHSSAIGGIQVLMLPIIE